MPIVVVEQGKTAVGFSMPANGMIDSMPKIAVFFQLDPDIMRRIG
jgi:hypothetical protein